MSASHHNCSSHHCTDSSHEESAHGAGETVQLSKEDYLLYLAHQKEMKTEELRSAKQAYKIKLKNQRNKRSGLNVVDTSGNELQTKTAKRLFIMEHLAKMRLMESFGLGHTVPSLIEVLKKYREE